MRMKTVLVSGFVALVWPTATVAQIVNVNAKVNAANNPVVVQLEAGEYDVVPVSASEGGAYTAWSAHDGVSGTWLYWYRISSSEFPTIVNEPGGFLPSEADAFASAVGTSFTLTKSATVEFYVCDGPGCYQWAGDNVGGISLKLVTPLPPFSLVENSCPGTYGEPRLAGFGEPAPEQDVTLLVSGALELAPCTLLFGLVPAQFERQGCTLLFEPLLLVPMTTDDSGGVFVKGRWPADMPAGLEVFVQCYVIDPGVPAGFATSNTLVIGSQ